MVLAHRSLLITAGVGDGALIALGVKIPVRPRASIDSGSGFGTASVLEAITSQSIPRGRTVWGWEVRGKRGKKKRKKADCNNGTHPDRKDFSFSGRF